MTDINWTDDHSRGWVRTYDPRVIGVIRRDDCPEAPECCGNSLVKVTTGRGWYYEPSVEALRCCEWCPEPALAEAYVRAFEHFKYRLDYGYLSVNADLSTLTLRYMRMFHGVTSTVSEESSPYRFGDSIEVIGLNTADRTMHLGEWRAYFDGDVFGVGYLIDESWVDEVDDDVIEARLADVWMECWGFYGEEWAVESALSMDYLPRDLPEMLPVA